MTAMTSSYVFTSDDFRKPTVGTVLPVKTLEKLKEFVVSAAPDQPVMLSRESLNSAQLTKDCLGRLEELIRFRRGCEH